jgi:hypothetical protein
MLRWNLLKRALPMALSVCLTVQSMPATAYASEYQNPETAQVSEETVSEDNAEESEISETTAEESETTTEETMEASTAESMAETSAPENTILEQTTDTTDQSVVFDEPVRSYDSITLNYNAVETVTKIYYAPADQPEEEKSVSVYSSGSLSQSFSGLNSDTEYIFSFYGSGSQLLVQKRVSTTAFPGKVEYTVEADGSNAGTINISASASNCPEDVSSWYLRTDILDKDGNSVFPSELKAYQRMTETDTSNSYSVSRAISGLEANTKYTVKVWMQKTFLPSSACYAQKEYEVTTAKADFTAADVTLDVKQNTTTATSADYTITVNKFNGSASGSLKYRAKGSADSYATTTVSVSAGSGKGTLTDLQAGTEYEIILLLNGVKVEKTYSYGLDALNPVLTADSVDAYGFALTYKLTSSETDSETDSVMTYTVRPEYWDGSKYTAFNTSTGSDGYQELNSNNSYTYSFNTYTDYGYASPIKPDTEYNIRWVLRAAKDSSTAVSYYYQTIQTSKSSINAEQKALYPNQAQYEISLSDIPENMPSDASYSLYEYVKEGNGAFHTSGYSTAFSTSNDFTSTLTLYSLKDDTDYTVSFRDSDGKEYGSFTFTTPKDDRTLAIAQTTIYKHKFKFAVQVSGTNLAASNYIMLYYREKGETDWQQFAVEFTASTMARDVLVLYYNDEVLKEDTDYEYVLGIANTTSTSISRLTQAVTGVVHTKKDRRNVTVTESHGYTYAKLNFTADGFDSDSSYAYCLYFYRVKDTSEWTKGSYRRLDSSDTSWSATVTELTPGTEYEYAVVLSDSWNFSAPDSVEEGAKKVVGSFTTKAAEYNLTFTPVESENTYKQQTYTIKAQMPENESMSLNVHMLLSDEQTYDVTLTKKKDYQGKVTFSGLTEATEYSITELTGEITERVGSSDYPIKATLNADEIKFTTAAAKVPESIALSKDELKLNLSYDNYVKLTAATAPADAATEVVWSSADTKVATVQDGKVIPVGVGETVITAQSAYDASVKAECKVTVKNYVLGKTTEGVTEQYTDSWLTVYKGSTDATIGYYELKDGGTLTALSDYTVTSSKPGVATWSDGIVGVQTGVNAVFTFDKDGYQASIRVSVSPKAKAFGITGLDSSDQNYPAIDKGNGIYDIALASGLTYTAVGAITPKEDFDKTDFTWKSSDEAVATVTARGVITPIKVGTAEITVTAQESRFTDVSEVKFTVNVKEAPSTDSLTVYAYTNVQKTLKDVALPAELGEGWSWKYPSTPLYSLPANTSGYNFEVVYTGDTYYPYDYRTVNVVIGTITGMTVTEPAGTHSNVLLADGQDEITLSVRPTCIGGVQSGDYTTNVTCQNSDITITKNSNGSWSVKASKAGKYTLKTEISVGEKVVASGTYTITAVEESPISAITLSSTTENVAIQNGMISLDVSEKSEKGTINLTALATARNGKENTTTKLDWKITDKSVATVTVDKTDSHKAVVQVKGEGHAIIEVTAKDAAAASVQLKLEVQNHQPRVDSSKATVNMAFDYDNGGDGLSGSLYGSIEIVPVYDETIQSCVVYEGEKVSTNFQIENYGSNTYVVVPKPDKIKNGNYTCKLAVTTSAGVTYTYPLKVTVINKQPKVTAKVSGSMNLFYLTEKGQLDITLEKSNYSISSLTWDDGVNDADNCFSFKRYSFTNRYYIYQDNVQVSKGKLVNSNIATGTLKVKLSGVKEANVIKNVKIKYSYKKPTLKSYDDVTGKNVSTIVPSMENNNFQIYFKDSITKNWLKYVTSGTSAYYYNEITMDSENVSMSEDADWYQYLTYIGTKSKESITFTLDSDNWRESLKVTHTVKADQPKAVLTEDKLTYNTTYMNQVSTSIRLKGYLSSPELTDVEIKGADNKSQALLTDDILLVEQMGNYTIYTRLNSAKLAGQSTPNGTYTYNLTPYYTNAEGSRVALNTLKLKITFTDKAITAKVKAKGSIDLTYQHYSYLKKSVIITPKFSNLGTDYEVENATLTGEYSSYFTLNCHSSGVCYVQPAETGKLKAGQNYNLQVVYTIQTSGGDTLQVTSNTFKIKPKQTAPKITVSNNNQTLYAGASDLSRSYTLTTSNYYYKITGVSGGLDVNKDGKNDISVSVTSTSNNYAYLTVSLTDKDAVLAAAKGKSYSIPLTVKLQGRDGVSKDCTVTIKVNVKR